MKFLTIGASRAGGLYLNELSAYYTPFAGLHKRFRLIQCIQDLNVQKLVPTYVLTLPEWKMRYSNSYSGERNRACGLLGSKIDSSALPHLCLVGEARAAVLGHLHHSPPWSNRAVEEINLSIATWVVPMPV